MRAVLLALGSVALLAGCGNDKAASPAFTFVKDALVAKVRPAKAPADPVAQLSIDDQIKVFLTTTDKPLLRVATPARKVDGLYGELDRKGAVVTWVGGDSSMVTLRDGVMIATRGLPVDLMSAKTPDRATLAAGGSFERVHYYLDGADAQIRRVYRCTAEAGTESGQTVAGIHPSGKMVVESCQSDAGTITNQYWLDNTGKITASRQWVSQGVGYAEFAVLR